MSRIILLTCIFSLSLGLGCTGKKNSSTTSTPKAKRVVHLAIWNNYLSPEMQKKFQEKTGIEIKTSNYSSNEELLAKVQSGASGIDVAVPSDYMVNIMIKTGLLTELISEKLNNKAEVDPQWLNLPYDPNNKYSVPYAWSTTGIAYNKQLVKTPPKSWKDFYTNQEYAGKMSLLDDVREVTGSVLKMHGASINSISLEELKRAEKFLLETKSRIKMFRSDVIDSLTNKEVAVAQAYSSDSLQAALKTNGDIEFVIPEEGSTLAVDNAVILKGAKNVDEAHELINFLLSSDVNVSFVQTIRGGPILKSTKTKLPPELQKSEVLFPKAEKLRRLERIEDLGKDTVLYDELWTKVKSM